MRSNGIRIVLLATVTIACAVWMGCGAPDCKVTYLVMPATASADHTASFPTNSVMFAPMRKVSGACGLAAVMPSGMWSTSDSVNIHMDVNSGLATCLNATPVPATIRFTSSNPAEVFSTASLTCR